MKISGMRAAYSRLGKRFGIRTMLIFVTLSSVFAALIARPMYSYQLEQRVINELNAVEQKPTIPSMNFA